MRTQLLLAPFVGLFALGPACAPPRAVADLGTTPSLAPSDVTVGEEWKQPPKFTVELTEPAFLTLFVVVPNHAAQLLAFTSTDPKSPFSTGSHVLQAAPARQALNQPAGATEGGAYPDLGAACAVTDFVKETKQQDTNVITFATPTTSPPIVTCAVPGIGRVSSMPKVPFDRYLLVVASDKPVARDAIAAALERLDVAGSPREVTELVAELAARESGAAHWGARAIRY